MSVAIPNKLRYGSKIEPAGAKSQRLNVAPQNGTEKYYVNDTIIINLPTRNNLVFVPSESYLKFKVNLTNGTTPDYYRFDSGGAHGVIKRIRVFHGSNLLEDIDNYNLLAKMMHDLQVPWSSTYGKQSILSGTRNDLYGYPTSSALSAEKTYAGASVAAVVAELNETEIVVKQPNAGALMTTSNLTAATATSSTSTYCINLMSIIGTLCSDKYFPLFACKSSPIKVEIQLVSSALEALATNTAPTAFYLSDVEFVMNTIELSDAAMGVIQSSVGATGAPLQFALTSYKNLNWMGTIVNNSATSFAVPIPFKYSSLKSILITHRHNANIGVVSKFALSCNKFNLGSYYFRIGPNVVPSKSPTTISEYFSEVVKAVGSMSDLTYSPSIDIDAYSLDTHNGTSTTEAVITAASNNKASSGSFYVGLDLENWATASKNEIFAGWNSNTDDIFYYPSFTATNYGADVAVRIDAFGMFDQVIIFSNDTAYVQY